MENKRIEPNLIEQILDSRIILAPLSGVTDVPFRLLARRHGCKFAFTEMIDVNGIEYKNLKTIKMLDHPEEDSPLGVQLVGGDVNKILNAAKLCEDKGYKLLDINAGCPARKVIKGGKGSALLKDPEKLGDIISTLTREIDIPVTVKIRSGWNDENRNYLEVAKISQDAGAKALCIHSRTQNQMYRGKPDHNDIKEVKEMLTIPVIASGNLFSPQDVKSVFEYTDCDAVVIARGALGNPWIFKNIEKFLKEGTQEAIYNPTFQERKEVIKEHFLLCSEYYQEWFSFRRMYKHMTWYLKGLKNLDAFMKEYRKHDKIDEFFSFLDKVCLEDEKYLRF